MNKKNLIRFLTFIFLSTFVFAMSAETFAQKKPKKKARKIAKKATKLFNEGKYNDAIIKYAEALSISPHFPRARYFKGTSHYRQKQYNLAISELSLALSQGENPSGIYPIRMEAYAAQGNFEAAMSDAKEAVNNEPNNAYLNGFLGKMYIINKNYQDGTVYLENAVKGKTRDPNVFYYLAIGYNGLGNYRRQERSADMALSRGTSFSANSWFLSGDAAHKNRKYQKATKSYNNAINAYKNLIETNRSTKNTKGYLFQAYTNLANIYRNLNQFDKAIKAAKAGLGVRPSDKKLHIRLARYYSLSGNRDFAIQAGERAIQIAPDQYLAYTNLCRAYNSEGEFLYKKKEYKPAENYFRKALRSCKKALSIEDNDGETNYYLGRSYFYLDNDSLSKTYYEKSVDGLVKFTQDNPDYSDGFYILGNAYFATDDKDNAIKAYKECLRITPRFALVRYNLGYVYFKNGETALAREQYEVLKRLDNDLAERLLGVIS